MNRTIALTGLTVLALTILPSSHASARGFIRPTIAYVIPEADGYDNAGYLGFAAGFVAGPGHQHEISAEIGATGWEFDEREGSVRVEGQETYVPMLVSYRCYAQPEGSKVRFFIGPSVGFTHVQYEVKASGQNLFSKDETSEFRFTLAGNVGVDFRLSTKLSLNVGYRYLYIDGGNAELFGADIEVDESKAQVIFAGLNIRF
jgi:opacity protein-like surface antigen